MAYGFATYNASGNASIDENSHIVSFISRHYWGSTVRGYCQDILVSGFDPTKSGHGAFIEAWGESGPSEYVYIHSMTAGSIKVCRTTVDDHPAGYLLEVALVVIM